MNQSPEEAAKEYAKGLIGDYDPELQEEFDAIAHCFIAGWNQRDKQGGADNSLREALEAGKKLAQATSNLIQDIKSKPNDTRYATYTKKALEALENWLNVTDPVTNTANGYDTPNNIDY